MAKPDRSRGVDWVAQWRPTREHWVHALIVLVLCAASLFVANSSVWFAQYFVEKGAAFEPMRTIDDGMFRWDSVYYYSIATEGYLYDGDPCRSQNVVFLPAFPLLTRAVALTSGLDVRTSGFIVVRLSLLLGTYLLFRWVHAEEGLAAAVFVTVGLLFSPGSFAFHAWYSESLMLLFLALALVFHRRGAYLAMGVAACALGATRVTVVPFAGLMAGVCLYRAWQRVSGRPSVSSVEGAAGPWRGATGWGVVCDLSGAVFCLAGVGAWLAYLGLRFGNPLVLISQIKYCAWGKVHQPLGVFEWITLSPLIGHVRAALERSHYFVLDIQTTNLLWTLAAAAATLWALVRRKGDLVSLGFLGYFALTFYANGKSEWLESSFRYYAPMFTIYLAGHAVWAWLRSRWPQGVVDALFGALLAVQIMYMIFHQVLFTVQRGHYF